jgi:beta-mannosidase
MRLVPGVLASNAFGVWRRSGSGCDGALIWLARDFEPGAGWGLMDALGRPKAAYHALRRVLAPHALWFVDDGLDGLSAHLANDSEEPLLGTLQLRAYSPFGACVGSGELEMAIGPRDQARVSVEEALGRFLDVTYAYRFGLPQVEVVWGHFAPHDGEALDAHYLPWPLDPVVDPRLTLEARLLDPIGGTVRLEVAADRLARFVHVDVPGYRPEDDRFHLAPGQRRQLQLRPEHGATEPNGWVHALNAPHGVRLTRP